MASAKFDGDAQRKALANSNVSGPRARRVLGSGRPGRCVWHAAPRVAAVSGRTCVHCTREPPLVAR